MFPAFIDATDTEINSAIALSAPWFNVRRWDTSYSEGLGNFVAHQIVIGRADKAVVDANDITMRHTEHLITARSQKQVELQARDPFQRTVFGQRYRYLARLVGLGMVAV
ncbi:MAG TPA: DUF4054 domain-containing protein [Gemmatimonadales bacterium]|nr:DUF4054 domain-containing protein [Gemmatimonadales bacterium]